MTALFIAMLPALLYTAAVYVAFAIAILRGRTVGGLTFCRIGRLGFSFYISQR